MPEIEMYSLMNQKIGWGTNNTTTIRYNLGEIQLNIRRGYMEI